MQYLEMWLKNKQGNRNTTSNSLEFKYSISIHIPTTQRDWVNKNHNEIK